MVQVPYHTHGCMVCTQVATNVCQVSVHSSGLLTFDIASEAELGQTVDCRSHPREQTGNVTYVHCLPEVSLVV